MNRRTIVKTRSAVAAAGLAELKPASAVTPMPAAAKLPRWRGFNLLEKFITSQQNAPFRESDFEWMAEWGFDFARLPMSYWCWSDPANWRELREPVLREIDAAVAMGRRHGIHVSLNFHRAPGYSVDRSVDEPFNLWTDTEAQEACAYHWSHFAERYAGIPSTELSFDLLNEPGTKSHATGELLDDATYARVARLLVEAIRAKSPDRLIIADGLFWGRVPVPALAELGVAQSTRGYDPMEVSHWKAEWVGGSDSWPEPTWPLAMNAELSEANKGLLDRFAEVYHENPIVQRAVTDPVLTADWNLERIRHQLVRPWKELEAMGVGVHVGEFGAYNKTPHGVVLRWMRDLLTAWNEAGWGWALWNLRGSFGIVDSERTDVSYESFRGHKLDRAMLELLREF